MIVTQPISSTEKDLLTGNKKKALLVTDLDGQLIKKIRSPFWKGWTHESLAAIDYDNIAKFGWDAYLGTICSNDWIGSSEV